MKRNKRHFRTTRQRIIMLFVQAMCITLGFCVSIGAGAVWSYNKYIYASGTSINESRDKDDLNSQAEQLGEQEEVTEPDHINKNLAVFGVDDGGTLTDVIFVVNFNSQTNEANVISLPRDTRVEWTSEQQERLAEYGRGKVYVSKLNEMASLGGGIQNIRDFTVNQIENILGIPIDNYVVVDLAAFRKIVDAVGGVEVDVPHDMYYTDYSGGLFINLKAGVQVLDGEKAEQFVRYRQYRDGDVGRISNQQLFLEAFAKQVLSPSIITKIPSIVMIVFGSLQTDIKLSEIPQYYQYLDTFDINNLHFHVVPGWGATAANNLSYYFLDMNEMDNFLEEIFKTTY